MHPVLGTETERRTRMEDDIFFVATLSDWLRHQLHEQTPNRHAIHEAVQRGDPQAVRDALAGAPFSPEQRRYLDDLLDRWAAVTHGTEGPRDSA